MDRGTEGLWGTLLPGALGRGISGPMQLLQGAFYIALPSIPGEVYLVAQPSFGPGYKPLSTQRSTLCDMRCWEELSLEGQSPTPFCLE